MLEFLLLPENAEKWKIFAKIPPLEASPHYGPNSKGKALALILKQHVMQFFEEPIKF